MQVKVTYIKSRIPTCPEKPDILGLPSSRPATTRWSCANTLPSEQLLLSGRIEPSLPPSGPTPVYHDAPNTIPSSSP